MTYRQPLPPADETDPEAAAIQELGRRASRLRTSIIIPLLLLGLALGAVLYHLFAELQYGWRGAHMPWLTGLASFGPMFGGSLRLAPRLADAAVRRRLPGWRRSLAEAHGLDLAQLEETTRVLE